MPKIDLATVPVKTGSIYPEPYATQMQGRSSLRLGQAGGLTQFGRSQRARTPTQPEQLAALTGYAARDRAAGDADLNQPHGRLLTHT